MSENTQTAEKTLIEVIRLGRDFGSVRAVGEISFKVKKGDVLGFLGPNGAGKSTTMKMITGFIAPSRGQVLINGTDISQFSRKARSLIGYLPENAPIYTDMNVVGFLNFIAEIRGILDPSKRKDAVERVVNLTSLQTVADRRIEGLSKGFKRRVGLAQALIHDPDILILDEPTDGLDPNQKHEVRTLITKMSSEKCIVLSTHILEEVDAVCNRAIIISKGDIVADNTPSELKNQFKAQGLSSLDEIFRSITVSAH